MNKILFLVTAYLFFVLVHPLPSEAFDFGSLLNQVQKTMGGNTALSQGEVVDGLKQALSIGTGNTVQALSKAGGYYDNPKVRIPLPGAVQKCEKILRATGFGSQVDEFELSMNRAAEKAAPQAKALFIDAIKQMTFSDAKKILDGPDNAATSYFQEKTTDKLQALFKPIIQRSMEKVGVTQYYKSLADRINSLPVAGVITGNYLVDLDSYVTKKSIDGLFVRLAEEEAKIRNDPAARVTDLLKKVFR